MWKDVYKFAILMLAFIMPISFTFATILLWVSGDAVSGNAALLGAIGSIPGAIVAFYCKEL